MGSLLSALSLPPKPAAAARTDGAAAKTADGRPPGRPSPGPAGKTPVAAKTGVAPKTAAAGKTAAAAKTSPEARRLTQLVMQTLLRVDALAAAQVPEAARLRQAVVRAARDGKGASGREAATKALQVLGVEIDLLSTRQAAAKTAKQALSTPAEETFDVNVGGKALKGATRAQVCAELGKVVDALESELKRGFEAHCYELQIQRDEPFAAWVSGGIGALKAQWGGDEQADIMDLSIWDAPQQGLRDARAALRRQDMDAVIALVPKIRSGARSASGKVSRHNAGSIDSAQTAIDGLRKVEEVSADVVGTVAEKVGGKAAGVAVKAAYKSAQNAAEQASAVHIAEIQKEIDWGAVAKEGVASAAGDIVGLLVKGPMAEKFSGLFGPYLKKADWAEPELEAMAKALDLPLPVDRDFLMTRVQRWTKDFLLDKGKGFVTGAVADAIKGKKPSDPPQPIDELMVEVAQGAISDKLLSAFAGFVVSKAGGK